MKYVITARSEVQMSAQSRVIHVEFRQIFTSTVTFLLITLSLTPPPLLPRPQVKRSTWPGISVTSARRSSPPKP